MIQELIRRNRSYRRFYQDFKIEHETLTELVNCARLSASAKNFQPLKYILACDSKHNDLIFPNLAWAGFLKDCVGPKVGEHPSGYIIILSDNKIQSHRVNCDLGIACQSILLGATEKGFGGCIIAAVNKTELRKSLNISDEYEIQLVIAIGKPKETIVIDEIDNEESTKYWREDDGTHHVPKRKLEDIILELK
ncbi:MAG: nitroreductase family protein [Candidatus Marinimicrobia bacterium]|nr:nitroreductase family protein [Candidatus Neomarinimicrobiota bacterium]MBL7022868.1 nitroreductase family protein [Candidatus Neomarinimicrobiota bacterium]MBL7109187.1 nitroreductase family protein [Candidatus Neomarinimicrobiota bacterium]